MRAVKARQIVLLTGDLVVLYISLAITLLARYGVADFAHQLNLHLFPMGLIFVFWLIIFYVNGLYDLLNIKVSLAFLRRFTESWLIAVGTAVTLFYLVPIFNITPRTNLFILSIVFAAMFVLWRFIISSSVRASVRVLAINPNSELITLLTTLQKNPQLGYQIIGIISDDEKQEQHGLQTFSTKTPIRAIVSEHHVGLIVMPFNTEASAAKLYGELYELLFWDVYTMPADAFFESLSGRISFASLQDSWFFENLQPNHATVYEVFQRAADYVFATLGLLALLLLTPFVALATKIQSPGPLFYLQERIGKSGRRFKVIKFRTMHALEKDGGAELSGAQFTTQDDPRITKIGKIIRSLRIDELPQVINVLKGEMSIIGPRPERPQFVEQFEKHMPYYTVRNLVKPGLTGWAQINYPYAETTEQQLTKFQYDLFYIKNRSLMLDLTIILKTLHVILYGKGR